MTMRNAKTVGSVIICLAVIAITLLSSRTAGNYKKNYCVVHGRVKGEKIEPSNEKVWLNISVQDQNNAIDIYIMRLSDFSPNRYLEDNFSVPIFPWFHNITQVNFTFDPPDDEDYIVVMDNSDNALENDTVPENDVIVELNIKYKKSEKPMTVKGIIISMMAILFVYYSLFLYFKRKKEIADKKKKGDENNERRC